MRRGSSIRLPSRASAALAALTLLSPAHAAGQFFDGFEASGISRDPEGRAGWAHFAGAGEAEMSFEPGPGYATIRVDARADRRGVWWALIKRAVSTEMDLEQLSRPGWELRVEARIRASHAPRRVNLHVNTQRTTDFHSHLMEFDIPEADTWRTISMTTRGFPARPGDTVFGQLALMDWGSGRYRVDVDHFRVDVVEAAAAGPDLGEPIPYHPPVGDPARFAHSLDAAQAAVIDLGEPAVPLHDWSVLEDGSRRRLLTIGGSLYVILRFDRSAFAGRRAAGSGLLELTSHSVLRSPAERDDFGLARLVEVLGGDPAWEADSVAAESFLDGRPPEDVLNPQMIIDWPVNEERGGRTYLTIPRPVLQRLIDGRTLGLAVRPLGSLVASFDTAESGSGPRLLFDLE